MLQEYLYSHRVRFSTKIYSFIKELAGKVGSGTGTAVVYRDFCKLSENCLKIVLNQDTARFLRFLG
jgi:hypothetical protein